MQKFFAAVVTLEDALILATNTKSKVILNKKKTTVKGLRADIRSKFRQSDARSEVYVKTMKLEEGPQDYLLSYNSFRNAHEQDDFYTLNLTCWVTILTIAGLVVVFGLLIAQAACRANLPHRRERRKSHVHRMYMAEGNIDALAFPSCMGERVSFGMCSVSVKRSYVGC